MNVWDKFGKLEKLDIGFYDNAFAKSATIYGNSQNQVEIYVKVKIVDNTNKPFDIPDEELIKNLYFIRYIDGSKNLNSFNVTNKKSDYVKVVKWDGQVSDTNVETHAGEKIIKYYVSASEDKSIDLSIAIHIPGVGDFNTSDSGTITRNGPRGEIGSIFVYPKLVHVNSMPAIDYGLSKNIRVELGKAEYINSFNWETRIDKTNDFTYQDNGGVWRSIIEFYPSKEAGDSTFKYWDFHSESELSDSDVSLGSVKWKGMNYESYKSGLEWPFDRFPNAIVLGMQKGENKNQTHVNFWFKPTFSGDNYKLNGQCILRDEEHTYLVFLKTRLAPALKDNKTATMCSCKFIIPGLAKSKEYNWVSATKSPEFTVTDHFGNTGKFKLLFDGEEYFDKPGIQPVR